MRERILNNNSLSSFEFDPIYKYNIDRMNNDLSMKIEGKITQMMANHDDVLKPVISLISQIDSEKFCEQIIKGNPDKANSTS
jgi:hypothetical protein